ncbi:ArdC-like ssDNA-binding domain-containing protein [Rhodococcus sp. NPDC080181]|uniref:ArdC-like ssDNA-binding domain-containing protein n=1 Tax=Rhodococcus sp. NPDC080181 TaxID=3155292 RepID=UPI003450B081
MSLPTSAAATPSVAGLRRSRTITLRAPRPRSGHVGGVDERSGVPPAGGAGHPAGVPEPSSAALRTAKEHSISCRTSGSRRSCITRARRLNPSLRCAADKAEARRELAASLHTSITDKVAELTSSDTWRAYLDHVVSFHSYSFNNVLLILSQKPEATQVAGFRAWQQRGRQVRKGEKAIRIYGYSSRTVTETDPDTGDEETRKVPTFPILSVFDHSQTDPIEGHPQPEEIAQLLTGADPDAIYDRVAAIMTGRGWTVTREAITSSANGYTTTDGSHRIVVDAALEPAAAAKTMIHEAAHAIMHAPDLIGPEARKDLHRGRMEVEAESVAYVLAGMLGLDTSAYSVGYIAGWAAGDLEQVTATAKAVLTAVHELADALDESAAAESDDSEDTGTGEAA